MTSREYIKAYPGETDSEILARCKADPATARPIPLVELRAHLSDNGLRSRIRRTADSLPAEQQAAADLLRDFLDFVADGQQALDTTDPVRAAKADAMLQLLVMMNGQNADLGLTQAQVDAIIALGGGYAVRNATLEQIAAERLDLAKRTEMAETDLQLQQYNEAYYAARDAYLAGTGQKPVVAVM